MFNITLLIKISPLTVPRDYKLEIFNEVCVCLCTITYYLLSPYVESYKNRVYVGWVLVGITLLNIFVNFAIGITLTIVEAYQ